MIIFIFSRDPSPQTGHITQESDRNA